MRKILASAALIAAAFSGPPASATVVTFNLNCVISNTPGGISGGSSQCANPPLDGSGNVDASQLPNWGTLTLDDGNNSDGIVDIKVDLFPLNSASGQAIQSVYLNFDPTKNPASYGFNTTADVGNAPGTQLAGVSVNVNNQKPDGYPGFLDLVIPLQGNLNFQDPYLDQIVSSNTTLSANDFNFKDTSGILFAAVHIGTCGTNTGDAGCDPAITGNESIWVGSIQTGIKPPEPPNPAPEPGILWLLGSGLLGLRFAARNQQRKACHV